ncbi:Uncharacterised protein [Mycobacterium tuberculosis]|uniref:Uncharacterized protein n=1 Tax=Mycobacterium tuberculosis TaxID=1773 RepID=A0A916L902_MYCTX|nr:Uncharacterised protein [Mycobacterium tuberculosis]
MNARLHRCGLPSNASKVARSSSPVTGRDSLAERSAFSASCVSGRATGR